MERMVSASHPNPTAYKIGGFSTVGRLFWSVRPPGNPAIFRDGIAGDRRERGAGHSWLKAIRRGRKKEKNCKIDEREDGFVNRDVPWACLLCVRGLISGLRKLCDQI